MRIVRSLNCVLKYTTIYMKNIFMFPSPSSTFMDLRREKYDLTSRG
jgi:hypothetical protein